MHLPLLARHPRAQSGCSTAMPCLALQPVARPIGVKLQLYHSGAVAPRHSQVTLPRTLFACILYKTCSLGLHAQLFCFDTGHGLSS